MSLHAVLTKKEKLLLLHVPGIDPGPVILRTGFVAKFELILFRMIKLYCALRQYQESFSR